MNLKRFTLAAGCAFLAVMSACASGSTQAPAAADTASETSSSAVEAPNFTLNDLQGKPVSLSDFRGKWVVLDFWGSWCGWCVRGIPAMKEAYAKYKGKLEIIGIDCGDTPEQWRAAVDQFQLPWVNVYNPMTGNGPETAYGVQGFPTKVIVAPDGTVVDVIVGEDPAFYTELQTLIK